MCPFFGQILATHGPDSGVMLSLVVMETAHNARLHHDMGDLLTELPDFRQDVQVSI
jgi:hypothetical protein